MKTIITQRSKYGHKTRRFLACDDGSRICWGCAQPVDGRIDEYGAPSNIGECHNCGLTVQDKAIWDQSCRSLVAKVVYRSRLVTGPRN